jgi:hypothetical protein
MRILLGYILKINNMIVKLNSTKAVECEDSLYHYTSVEVLCCLLKSITAQKWEAQNQEPHMIFRATHIRFLNDKSEYQFFITKLKMDLLQYDEEHYAGKNKEIILKNARYLAFMTEYVTEPSVISFCKKRDDLTMWNLYGDHNKGVCLEFDWKKLDALDNVTLVTCNYVSTDEKYFKDSDLEIALGYLKSIPEKPSRLVPHPQWIKIIDQLSYTKNKDYQDEAECRLIAHSNIYDFATKNECIRPHLNIPIPVDALKSITIGPCTGNSDMGILGIQTMLNQVVGEKAKNIRIIKSKKDFRII